MDAEILDNLRLELRRGSLILAVLAQLRVEQYGYTLRQELAAMGLRIEESALYPMLRRLETQGLLASQWREQDSRNKRYCKISPSGDALLRHLVSEWRELNSSLERILGKGSGRATARSCWLPAGRGRHPMCVAAQYWPDRPFIGAALRGLYGFSLGIGLVVVVLTALGLGIHALAVHDPVTQILSSVCKALWKLSG